MLKCSFCDIDQKTAKRLIAGPAVNICDECVGICVDVLSGEARSEDPFHLHGAIEKMAATRELVERTETAERETKHLRMMAALAVKGLYEELGKDIPIMISCMWCDVPLTDRVVAREHAASCAQHPAVIALAAAREG